MLDLLAQTTYTYTTTELDTGSSAGLALFSGFFLVIWLAVALVMIISMWKIFEKAGEKGWKALIPIYNYWTLCEIVGKPGWWSLAFLLSFIPILGYIIVLVVSVIITIELVKSFGKEAVWALILIIVPIVGYPMLAFGPDKYVGPGGKPNGGAKPKAPAAA